MVLSVRLDEELNRLVRRTAKAMGRTKSDLVKASLQEYCERAIRRQESAPYLLAQDLLGLTGSGKGDLSTRGRKDILEILNAKRNRRPR